MLEEFLKWSLGPELWPLGAVFFGIVGALFIVILVGIWIDRIAS